MTTKSTPALVGLLIVLALAGCRVGPFETTVPAKTSTSGERQPCKAEDVRALVTEFVVAFNEGDLDRLDAIYAEPPTFKWYSASRAGERFEPEAYNRDTLIDYFAERHAAGERMRLRSFRFNGYSGGVGHFELRLARQSPDYQDGRWFRTSGKGAVYCTDTTDTIAVWSM